MATVTLSSVAQGSILTGTASTGIHNVWKDAVLAPNGIVQTTTVSGQQDVGPWGIAGRSGTQYRLARTYCYFDTSSYLGTITGLSLEFDTDGASGISEYIVCESYAYSNGTTTTLAGGDFDRLNSWDPSTNLSNNNSFAVGSNSATLNASAVSLANGGTLNLVIIDYDYDYPDTDPGTGTYYGTMKVGSALDLVVTYTAGFDSINGTTYTGLSQVNSVNRTGIQPIDEINSIQA
jgi:hypothetical protein